MTSSWRTVLSVLHFASDTLTKLPHRGDSPLELLFKGLAILDSAEKTFGGRRRAFSDVFGRYALRERTSQHFKDLFFGTTMKDGYSLSRIIVDEYQEIIEAVAPDGERLFFQEYRWGRPVVSSTFFHTKGFNFAAAMDRLWEGYPDGLYLSISAGEGKDGEASFSPLVWRAALVMSRAGEQRIRDRIARHKLARMRGQHRSYIFVGPPRTGKSDMAVRMARAQGGRLLNLDASSLAKLDVQELRFLLDALQPNFLVLDDFDEAPVDGTRARMRYVFQTLKLSNVGCSIVITVNDPKRVDHALLHAGRIDEAVDFTLPDEEERRDLIERMIAHHGLKEADVAALVTKTAGFDHAGVADLCERLAVEDQETALASMLRLRELATQAEGAAASKSAGDTPPSEPPPARKG